MGAQEETGGPGACPGKTFHKPCVSDCWKTPNFGDFATKEEKNHDKKSLIKRTLI